jgi:CheY-like chemotaxis protein
MDTKRPAKILVVEDDAITATAIQEILTVAGYTVVDVVSTGAEAIDRVASLRPDLILMDIRLKGPVDGVSTTQQIRSLYDTPVVYLTALSDDDTLKRVIHSQPYGYIVKPFTEDELCNSVELALRQYRRKHGLGSF